MAPKDAKDAKDVKASPGEVDAKDVKASPGEVIADTQQGRGQVCYVASCSPRFPHCNVL